jgi:hypothetical protein
MKETHFTSVLISTDHLIEYGYELLRDVLVGDDRIGIVILDTDDARQVARASYVLDQLGYEYHSTDPAAGTVTYEVVG